MGALDLPRLLSSALAAVVRGAAIARHVQSASFIVQSKSDASPVTTADLAVQCSIATDLSRAALPSDPPFSLIGEEESGSLASEGVAEAVVSVLGAVLGEAWTHEGLRAAIDLGAGGARSPSPVWILDPVDGTKGFVRGAGHQYAVGLALLHGGVPVLAVIAAPHLPHLGPPVLGVATPPATTGCLFYATAGGGAWQLPLPAGALLPSTATPTRLHCRPPPHPSGVVMAESFEGGHSDHTRSAALRTALGMTAPPLRLDSMVKYGLLARGDAGVYTRFPRPGYAECVWDHAPGALLLAEAGGVTSDMAGNPLDFSQGSHLPTSGLIASGGAALHASVLAALG